MAELNTCCATDAQATCCEPADEAECCGTSAAGGSCGCAAAEPTGRFGATLCGRFASPT